MGIRDSLKQIWTPWDFLWKNSWSRRKIKDGKLFFVKSRKTRHNIFGLWSLDLLKQLEKDLNN